MYRWKRLHLLFLVALLTLLSLSVVAARTPDGTSTAAPGTTRLIQENSNGTLLAAANSDTPPASAPADDGGPPLLYTWTTLGLFLVLGSGAFLIGSRFVPRA